MKTAGNATITLLQGHELMCKIMLMALLGDYYAMATIHAMVVTCYHMR